MPVYGRSAVSSSSNACGGSAADEMSANAPRHALDGSSASSTFSDSNCGQFAYASEALTTTPVFPQRTPAPSPPADNARALQSAVALAPAALSSWVAACVEFLLLCFCSDSRLEAAVADRVLKEGKYQCSERACTGGVPGPGDNGATRARADRQQQH